MSLYPLNLNDIHNTLVAHVFYTGPQNVVAKSSGFSPAAEVGNQASLITFFFFTDSRISLWDICNCGCGVFTLGQLKKFKMAAAKRYRFVLEMFISGRKHETSYFGLLE